MKDFSKTTLILYFACLYSISFAQSTKVKLQPRKSWIEDIRFNESAQPKSGQDGSHYYLLIDDQENTSLEENYIHYVYKILTNEGIQEMSDLNFVFDPAYEELTLHQVTLHRGGNSINQLSQSKIKTIQREESMDRFLYDGSLTAIIHLSDVRVGDIIEYSFTRKGYNPVSAGHITRRFTLDFTVPYEKSFYKIILQEGRALNIKNENTDLKPQIKKDGRSTSYVWSLDHNNALIYDNHEPDWYDPGRHILVSDFNTWNEVAVWASGLYKLSESDKRVIKDQVINRFDASDVEKYTLQAIRFVQDEVRYLGFEEGLNSHKPHPPIKVFEQRFGDCKDKSLLLATILQAKGIDASPVLVSTIWRDQIEDKLPSPDVFNHCIVQVKLNNQELYFDPTINNQGGSVFNTYFPTYRRGLVIDPATTKLVLFKEPVQSTISEEQVFDLSSIGGDAVLSVRTVYTGNEADAQRSHFSKNNRESIEKTYLTFYGNLYPDVQKFDTIKTEDNRLKNVFVVEEKYKIPTLWKSDEKEQGKISCEFYPQSLETYFNVTKSSQRSAPYALTYPVDYSHHIQINLPEKWNLKPRQEILEQAAYHYEFKTSINSEEDVIHIYTSYRTNQNHVDIKDFEKFVSDHQKMMSNLSYSLTYNRNLEPARTPKWPALLVSVLSAVLGLWLIWWLYKRYDPAPYFMDVKAERIGGWLILVAFGVTLSPFRIFFDLFSNPDLLNGGSWSALLAQENYGLLVFVVFEHVYNIINLLFSILLVVLFYKRRSSVPRLLSIFYLVNCLVLLLEAFYLIQTNNDAGSDKGFTKSLIQSIVATAIWVPYFNISSRVKETFVNRSDDYMESQPN